MRNCIYFYDNKILGMLGIASKNEKITNIIFGRENLLGMEVAETPITRRAAEEIFAYANGEIKNFSTPLEIGGTTFQHRVWNALLSIPFGETRSYKQIAEAVGCTGGYRAVGMANSRNKIPILIPCHRVINSNGGLGGYYGGLEIKKKLLKIEGMSSFLR